MVGEAVQKCGGELLVAGEDLWPLREGQVAGDQDAGALITVAEYPKRQLDATSVHGDVTQLVEKANEVVLVPKRGRVG